MSLLHFVDRLINEKKKDSEGSQTGKTSTAQRANQHRTFNNLFYYYNIKF